MRNDAPPAKYTRLNRDLYTYILAHRTPDDAVVASLLAETARLGSISGMQVAPEQAAFLKLMVSTAGAKRALEIGTFTGLSGLSIARGLAAGGKLLCLDVSEEWTAIARRHWERAGVLDRIDLRLGPALATLRSLPQRPTFDFVFLDADKQGYPAYWDEIILRLLPGGLVVVDNVLQDGDVARPSVRRANTRAVRTFNDTVAADPRVESVMIAVADGLTLARRR